MGGEPPDIEQRQLRAFGDFQRVECQEVGGGDEMLLERWQEMCVRLGGEIRNGMEKVGHGYSSERAMD